MAQYVIATTKSWNIENSKRLKVRFPEDSFYLITDKEELTEELLERLQPRYVFFPHWSWIIPAKVYENYECVVFHMTDLPFGRGGSPLQNLLVRGIYETKISAIKVEAGLDTGPIYLKMPVDLSEGSADDLFRRISDIIFEEMIPRFLQGEIIPCPQEGEPVSFKRRTPEQSEIPEGLTQRQLYDYIRMLDGEGYPTAYRDCGDVRIYFRNAQWKENTVIAEAEFKER